MQTEQQTTAPKIIIATPCAFPLGTLATTRAVFALMQESPRFQRFVVDCITRHASGDWGELDEHDTQANANALAYDGRLLSNYPIPATCPETHDGRVWIITEADRAHTTVLFPSEY